MTGLVELFAPDRVVRLDLIRSIGAAVDKPHTSNGGRAWTTTEHPVMIEYLGDNGERYARSTSLLASQVEELLCRPVQLIPAVPGTELLRSWYEDGEVVVEGTPVIAWALCVDGDVRPLTPNGVNDGAGRAPDIGPYVELPGGRIEGVGELTDPSFYSSRETMKADLLEYHARKAGALAND